MQTGVKYFVLVVAAALVLGGATAGPNRDLAGSAGNVVETFPEPAVGGVDPLEERANQAQLHDWLVSEMPAGALQTPTRIHVSAADLVEVDRADAENPGTTVVGLTKHIGRKVDLSGLKPGDAEVSFSGGVAVGTGDGGFVWTTSIVSPGAAALRIFFSELDLPSTTDLFIYSLDGQAFGPYSAVDVKREFWSHTIFGSEAIVQLRQYGPAGPREMQQLQFTLAELGHIGQRFLPAAGVRPITTQSSSTTTGGMMDLAGGESDSSDPSMNAFCAQNEPCINNTNCSGGPAWSSKSDAENATALMLWIQGAFIHTCTGGLLADTDAGSQIPYFLTANHCLSKNNVAGNVNFFFQFDVNCGGNCPSEWTGGGIQRSGSSLKASKRTGDYTLLELDQAPPGGSVFMGWTTANVANSNGTSLFRISHPSTAPQAYSAQTVDTSAGTCQGIPRGNWIYSRDTYGATEGGSSGSPVYNDTGQVVGQLTGACGTNTGDPCDSNSNATIDGAFANYFSDIEQFLDASPCNPSPEVCDNGSDDDCDGSTDCSDSDCTGDPACADPGCVNPGGADPGASCTSNSDCCSNKCKGPPSNKTCR